MAVHPRGRRFAPPLSPHPRSALRCGRQSWSAQRRLIDLLVGVFRNAAGQPLRGRAATHRAPCSARTPCSQPPCSLGWEEIEQESTGIDLTFSRRLPSFPPRPPSATLLDWYRR
ncbi:hypothetical protein ZWY2020_032822 [Hordeum vulgare]|nr:hypothetical protein ZWY2020_032822 [Hordeum vulgare]